MDDEEVRPHAEEAEEEDLIDQLRQMPVGVNDPHLIGDAGPTDVPPGTDPPSAEPPPTDPPSEADTSAEDAWG
jgi:hypothetical protein